MPLKLIFSILIFFPGLLYSQQFTLPLTRDFYNLYEEPLNKKAVNFHTSVKPYQQAELDSVFTYDSLYQFQPYTIGTRRFIGRVVNHFFNDHLIKVDTGDFYLSIDPLFNLEVTRDLSNQENGLVNTRGFWVNGSIGKKFSFSSSFYENQALFVNYLNEYVKANKVVPGQGEAKPYRTRAYDYSMASAYISFSPSRYFNFQLGNGKNFIGDGYRSLLLSDNSFNYPYFKITTSIWKIKYVNLYTQFQDIRILNAQVLGKGYPKKFGTFHYLSWNITKRFQLGFFESIIWQGSDSTHYRGFDFNYINPVIFYRPVEFSLGSADNALIGLNSKLKLTNNFYVFGQFILDDFKFSEWKKDNSFYHQKYGFQVGAKMLNLFKIAHLNLHTEYNQVMPYTYSHRLPAQNYGHYNQPIAHPYGANFKESVSFLSYRYKRFFIETKFIVATYGADSSGKNFGRDIYAAEYELGTGPLNPTNKIGQGLKNNLLYGAINLAYLINPKTNMRVELNYIRRSLSSSAQNSVTDFVSFGFRTNLQNWYYDF